MLTTLLLATILTDAQAADPEGRAMRVRLVNAASRRIHGVYISPSRDSDWGGNLLGQGAFRAGGPSETGGLAATADAEVAVTGPCGLYDVRIVAEKGAEFLLDEVELCEAGDVLTVTDGQLTHVKARDVANER